MQSTCVYSVPVLWWLQAQVTRPLTLTATPVLTSGSGGAELSLPSASLWWWARLLSSLRELCTTALIPPPASSSPAALAHCFPRKHPAHLTLALGVAYVGYSLSHRKIGDQVHLFPWPKQHLSGFPCWLSGKESTCQCRRPRFDPWSGKTPRAAEQLSSCAASERVLEGLGAALLSPRALEPVPHSKRGHRGRNLLPAPGQRPLQQHRPSTAGNKYISKWTHTTSPWSRG